MVDTVNGAAHTLQDKAQPAHSHVFLELVHASVLLVAVSATSDQLKDEMAAVKKDVKAAYQDALKAPNRLLTPAVPAVCAPAPAAS